MTILYSDPIFEQHETGSHPECARRLETIRAHFQKERLFDRCAAGPVVPADVKAIQRVHSADHVTAMRLAAEKGGGRVESDTVISERSYAVAITAELGSYRICRMGVGSRSTSPSTISS